MFPKEIRVFEIHRKDVDMQAWVKERFKESEYLILGDISQLHNGYFYLIPFQRACQYAEIKGELIENKVVYEIGISMAAQIGMLVGGLFGIILSIGLIEEGKYLYVIMIWGFYAFFLFVNYFLIKREIRHLDELLQKEIQFI